MEEDDPSEAPSAEGESFPRSVEPDVPSDSVSVSREYLWALEVAWASLSTEGIVAFGEFREATDIIEDNEPVLYDE